MLDALWWLAAAEIVGLAAWPLAYYLLPQLNDRGYSICKPLGLLVVGFASWLLSALHVVPAVMPALWLMLVVMASLSARFVWTRRTELKAFVVRERRALIAIEAVFLIFFVGWTVFRSFDPAIDHTEQPMDFAMLNAAIVSEVGQPEDAWMSGEPISYYYFGYWIFGTLSELTGIASNRSYNLAMALIPAMAAAGMFGLLVNMVGGGARWIYGIIAAAGAVFMLGIAANLEGVLEFIRMNGLGSQDFYDWLRIDGLDGPILASSSAGWAPQEYWWWFRATRVINTFVGDSSIDYTIQEFPLFSFMLGDMHPHVMAIPFGLLVIGFAWNWLLSPTDRWLIPTDAHQSSDARPAASLQGFLTVLVMGVVLGGLAFTNMWDGPTFAALLAGVAVVKAFSGGGRDVPEMIRRVLPVVAAILTVAFLAYILYYFSFTSSISGIEPVMDTTTRPIHGFIVWGLFIVTVVPFVITTFLRTTVREDWKGTTLAATLLWAAPFAVWGFLFVWNEGPARELSARLVQIAPLAALISMGAHNVFWLAASGGDRAKLFAMALAVLGMMLILGPELLFIGDTFGSRLNTVFKLYYQAWILLSVVSGYVIYGWVSNWSAGGMWRQVFRRVWVFTFAALLIGSVYYSAAALVSKGGSEGGTPTLDGLDFVRDSRPAEYRAIEYLRERADTDTVMVEAVGEWFDAGLISRSTGIPTIVNWPHHQKQWRGAAVELDPARQDPADACDEMGPERASTYLACRELDVARIYRTSDVEEAGNLLARYDVDYVYVGPRERAQYGEDGLAKFDSFMATVFSDDDVVIYQAR